MRPVLALALALATAGAGAADASAAAAPLSVSVVIPCFNCRETIAEALDTVHAAFAHARAAVPALATEVIVVDDASTDSSRDTVLAYARETGRPTAVLALEHNVGQATGRNRGVMHAEGDVVMFLDADDRYLPNHVLECHNVMQADPALGMASFLIRLPPDLGLHPSWQAALSNSIPITKCVRRSAHLFVGGFPEYPEFSKDYEDIFYYKILREFFPFRAVDVETAEYVLRPGNHFETQLQKFRKPVSVWMREHQEQGPTDVTRRLKFLYDSHEAALQAARERDKARAQDNLRVGVVFGPDDDTLLRFRLIQKLSSESVAVTVLAPSEAALGNQVSLSRFGVQPIVYGSLLAANGQVDPDAIGRFFVQLTRYDVIWTVPAGSGPLPLAARLADAARVPVVAAYGDWTATAAVEHPPNAYAVLPSDEALQRQRLAGVRMAIAVWDGTAKSVVSRVAAEAARSRGLLEHARRISDEAEPVVDIDPVGAAEPIGMRFVRDGSSLKAEVIRRRDEL